MIKDYLYKLSFLVVMGMLLVPCVVFANPEEVPTTGGEETPEVSPSPSTTPEPSDDPVVEVTKVEILKNLELTEGSSKELTVTITPDDATDKKVTWESSDSDIATVSDKGVVKGIKPGTATITVTSSNGKTATCKVTVTKKEVKEKSSDTSLKSLTITNGKLDKEFDNDNTKYTVTVNKSVTELEFDFEFNDKNAKYLISNNNSLITGKIVRFVAIAEDGETKKTYEFTIKKEEANLNLKSLKIKGYALGETFSNERLEYTAEIPYEAVDVTIETAPEDSDAKVKITGATGLIVGKNTVTILVTDTSGNKREYKIVVTRLAEDEREESNNSSKYTSVTSSDANLVDNNNDSSNSNKTNNTLKYVCVTLGCVILFMIGGIGVYFYIITSTKRLKKKINKNSSGTNNDKEESPLIETKTDKAISIMPGDLEETREFKTDDIIKKEKNDAVRKNVEELLDD